MTMTDKQIIIDGVDVSGCSYGEIEKSIFKCSCEYNVHSASMFCKDNPNCYYKQLKHKEQECEELKLQLAHSCHDVLYKNSLAGQLDQLKAELTRANCQIADDEILQCDMREAIEELKADREEALKQLEFVRTLNTVQEAENRKLTKTLVEIKFWARELLKRTGQVVPNEIKQILQKISECEGNDGK